MKSPTVAATSRIINGMSQEHYNRFRAQPFKVRMGIVAKVIRKKGLWKITKLIRAFTRPR